MRSTLVMTTNNTIRNLHKAKARYDNIVNQIATGQKVNKPSDDALAVTEGLRLSAVVSRLKQYNRNITNTGYSFLNLSEIALKSVSKQMNDAKALAVESATETTTTSMRAANAVELSSILQELVSLANSQESSRYLFGGTETTTTPYTIVGASYVYYSGNDEAVNIQVDSGTTVQINSTGEEVFGSMTSILGSDDLNTCLNMGGAYSTKLSELNGGEGVPMGSINIKMGSMSDFYPNGINVDLSACETIDDVAKKIEEVTRAASAAIDPKDEFVAPDVYLKTRYVKVALNAAGNGLTLRETDDIYEATLEHPEKRPTDYPGFPNDRSAYLLVSEIGGGSVASSLGIAGNVRYEVDPLNSSFTVPTALIGGDLDPDISKNTLLADLANYSDKAFTITNGSLPNSVGVLEVDDTANNFSGWYLTGLDEGVNTGRAGELYVRIEETESGSGEYRVNLYKNEKCTADSLVAQGEFGAGLLNLHEMNNSGVNGTVTMPPVANAADVAPVTLQMKFDDSFAATISLSSYQKETVNLSSHDVASDFRLRGMYPGGDPQNRSIEPCDYNGNFSMEIVNSSGDGTNPSITVNLYNNQGSPRVLIATGTLDKGIAAGTVALTGMGNFSDLEGSVYVDWTKNLDNAGVEAEASIAYNMKATFATVEDLINKVNSSNTYTTARIANDGTGIEIVSKLAGAHLMVTEQVEHATHYNDYGQLGDISFYTVMNGYNTDLNGKIYSNITTAKESETASVTIGGAAQELPIYTTTVSLYNQDPQSELYNDEKSLTGTAQLRAAYDEAAEQWYQYDAISGKWLEISLPEDTTLNIQQTNHSGLTGTLVLNSVRIPNGSSDSTSYYDTAAAAGQQNLTRAIVIDTVGRKYNHVVSNGDTGGNSGVFSYLENSVLKGVLPGVNSDADGNLTCVTGYKVTGDENLQVCNLNLQGINPPGSMLPVNTDNNGLFHAVTSYAVEGDDNAQINQLNLITVTNNLNDPILSDCTGDGKIYVEIGADNIVRFYNDPVLRIDPDNLVATADYAAGTPTASGQKLEIVPNNAVVGTRSLSGTFVVPVGALNPDADIVIDLNRSSVSLYSSDTLDTGTLVASGNSDSTGNVVLTAHNGSGLSGSLNIPTVAGRQRPNFDNSIVIDTQKQEVVLYTGSDYARAVAKGDILNQAGGEINLIALNHSGISGKINLNSVVESTDRYSQLQNVSLTGVTIGVDTDAAGCIYAEVEQDAAGIWNVNIYDGAASTRLVASGAMNVNTGVVNITQVGTSGISGSLQLANPPTWLPTAQGIAAGNGRITIDTANQHQVLVSEATGLQNSGEVRESNVFTTFNDTLDAMNNDDVDTLHDLLDTFEVDNTRFLTARATIGTRVDRLEMLETRHTDEVYNFTASYSKSIAIDYSVASVEKQNAENIYNAAMRVYSGIIQTSLVDFI